MKNMYDYFEILHEIAQWENELKRLQNEEPKDTEQIKEAQDAIKNYKAILTEEKTE